MSHAPTMSEAEVAALRALLARVDPRPDASIRVDRPPDVSFETFCLDRLASCRRPAGRVMSRGTFECTRRHLRRLGYLETNGEGGCVALRPPDWAGFHERLRTHERGAQSLENDRRALTWWSAYHGVPVPDEPWARRRLDDKASVAVARREGRMVERVRFFSIPDDLVRMVNPEATTYDDPLNAATFRCIAWSSVYLGPRGSELFHLRLRDVDIERGRVDVWAEKQKKRRPVVPPEPYAVSSLLDPTVAHYLKHIRPLLDPDEEYARPEDPVFLFNLGGVAGRPWNTPTAYAQFLKRGITRALGRTDSETPAPHAWRRACATLRIRNGWSIEQVATYIGDAPETIRASYVDWDWLGMPGVGVRRATADRPRIPRLRRGRAPEGATRETQARQWVEHSPDPETA